MGLFNRASKKAVEYGRHLELRSVLNNTSPADTLVFRLPEENFHTKSVLQVQPGEQAVFVRNGKIIKCFNSGKYSLTTSNYPFLDSLRSILTSGETAYSCQVFFVRTVTTPDMDWGDRISLRDPVLKVPTDVGINGTYKIRLKDGAAFLTEVFGSGRIEMNRENLEEYIRGTVLKVTKSTVITAIESAREEILGIEKKLEQFSNTVRPIINEKLSRFGMELEEFSITAMRIMDSEHRTKLEKYMVENTGMGILGDTRYETVRRYDVADKLAQNPGAGASAGMMAGFFGGAAMGNMMTNTMPNSSNQSSATSAAITCPKCGASLPTGSAFCNSCGSKIETQVFCRHCGQPLPAGSRFCNHCGKPQ